MKVLVLGGTGFIGSVIAKQLNDVEGVYAVIGARNRVSAAEGEFIAVDATDTESLIGSLSGIDVIVNCVTGSARTIQENAAAIVDAAIRSDSCATIVHMSSMAVYGSLQGNLDEQVALSGDCNWYGRAKIEAEGILEQHAKEGISSTIFRVGCVYGENSALWVDRIGLLIRSGRLGDLGELADGWSNLVHVDDVAAAVVSSIDAAIQNTEVYNLSAPDSPRWNTYFKDFALSIDCVPVKYKTHFSMLIESKIIAPPLKIAERLSSRGWMRTPDIQSIPPSLLRLWGQQIRLDSSKIERDYGFKWKTYDYGLGTCVDYFKNKYGYG